MADIDLEMLHNKKCRYCGARMELIELADGANWKCKGRCLIIHSVAVDDIQAIANAAYAMGDEDGHAKGYSDAEEYICQSTQT